MRLTGEVPRIKIEAQLIMSPSSWARMDVGW